MTDLWRKLSALTYMFLMSVTPRLDTNTAEVKDAFERAQLPQVLFTNFDPSVVLQVILPQASGPAVPVRAGKEIPVNATVGPPQFTLRGNVSPGQKFVVATVDPDAPSPQAATLAQVRHFLGGNFVVGPQQGSDINSTQLVNETAQVSSWLQPAPPPGSGFHRYTFLLFNQPDNFDQQTFVNSSTIVTGFNISKFAQEVGLGNPIAGSDCNPLPPVTNVRNMATGMIERHPDLSSSSSR